MEKLTREQMRAVNAGAGGGGVICKFISASCGNLCYDVDTAPYYYTSCAAAFNGPPGFNPTCHYTYMQVTHC